MSGIGGRCSDGDAGGESVAPAGAVASAGAGGGGVDGNMGGAARVTATACECPELTRTTARCGETAVGGGSGAGAAEGLEVETDSGRCVAAWNGAAMAYSSVENGRAGGGPTALAAAAASAGGVALTGGGAALTGGGAGLTSGTAFGEFGAEAEVGAGAGVGSSAMPPALN